MFTLAVCDVHGASSLYINVHKNLLAKFFYICICIICILYIYIYKQVFPFPYWGDGGSPPHQPKIYSFPHPPHQIFIPSRPKVNSAQQKNKNVIFSCSHCSCTILVLISYSFDTQIMLILILIDVQYSQNAVFSFEKGSNHQKTLDIAL